jgi:hypothetical protein
MIAIQVDRFEVAHRQQVGVWNAVVWPRAELEARDEVEATARKARQRSDLARKNRTRRGGAPTITVINELWVLIVQPQRAIAQCARATSAAARPCSRACWAPRRAARWR